MDRDANKVWLVALKVTYDLFPDGTTQLADLQLPVLLQGQHLGEPYKSSLRYEGDLYGVKPATDILLCGSAWRPGGNAGPSVDVEMQVGPICKRLRVFGDRVWEGGVFGMALSKPVPFVQMPIVYERAFGGWDRMADDPAEHRLEGRNPIGSGLAAKAAHLPGVRAPNVEYPSQLIGGWGDKPEPAGFLPVECHWSPRRELAGTYDQRWQASRAPLWAEDFDPRYHNAAPTDQQCKGYLQGGEHVALRNLTPGGLLAFDLPRIYPVFETRIAKEIVERRGRLVSVTIEPDVGRLCMVWQSALVLNSRIDDLDCTVIREKSLTKLAA